MDFLGPSMDNVLAQRLGEIVEAAIQAPAGDRIDRGLVLRRLLEQAGFRLVYRGEPLYLIRKGRKPLCLK